MITKVIIGMIRTMLRIVPLYLVIVSSAMMVVLLVMIFVVVISKALLVVSLVHVSSVVVSCVSSRYSSAQWLVSPSV